MTTTRGHAHVHRGRPGGHRRAGHDHHARAGHLVATPGWPRPRGLVARWSPWPSEAPRRGQRSCWLPGGHSGWPRPRRWWPDGRCGHLKHLVVVIPWPLRSACVVARSAGAGGHAGRVVLRRATRPLTRLTTGPERLRPGEKGQVTALAWRNSQPTGRVRLRPAAAGPCWTPGQESAPGGWFRRAGDAPDAGRHEGGGWPPPLRWPPVRPVERRRRPRGGHGGQRPWAAVSSEDRRTDGHDRPQFVLVATRPRGRVATSPRTLATAGHLGGHHRRPRPTAGGAIDTAAIHGGQRPPRVDAVPVPGTATLAVPAPIAGGRARHAQWKPGSAWPWCPRAGATSAAVSRVA